MLEEEQNSWAKNCFKKFYFKKRITAFENIATATEIAK